MRKFYPLKKSRGFELDKIFQWSRHKLLLRLTVVLIVACLLTISVHSLAVKPGVNKSQPKVILISLDGATPNFVEQYLKTGVLSPKQGLGLIKNKGVYAERNITCSASLTAACHIAISTGSTAARNDINANTFHLVASPFTSNISGFAAPIGGYSTTGPAASLYPTAEPLWIGLQQKGKKVVTATFPGADGVDVPVPGLTNSPIIQPASKRTVSYTVPFGAFAGASAKGFSLTAANFSLASSQIASQLKTAGKVSYSPIVQASLADQFLVGGVNYNIQVAALDTSNNAQKDYDTLVFFDDNIGIRHQPFNLPSTGPAYVRARDKKSSLFYLEGSDNKAGTAFYVSNLAPDLSSVRIARYAANAIPGNPAVQTTVDDINNNVGFWLPQSDYRIIERLSPGFNTFPDRELEAIYEDQLRGFVDYQTRVALRAIKQNPNASLVMVYIEQPDGSEHQFLLTDLRQATDPSNPNTIGGAQDKAKVARYKSYVQTAYRAANDAVQRIINAVGTDSQGKPNSNIIVVSDHGFSTFHTTVNLNNFLKSKGFDSNKVRSVTSGPAANIYINLQGREPNGIVSRSEYVTIQKQIVAALKELVDTNYNYVSSKRQAIFDKIYTRPLPANLNEPKFGLDTSEFVGQDSGDVFAIMSDGYNFDGIQSPLVTRLGDANNLVFSVPNFYGAHGYDPNISKLSAIFYAAGPDISRRGSIGTIHNIDVAPTINNLLGVPSASTVQGKVINLNSGAVLTPSR
ncbi:alkaline phosphatase family protein [Nostoc sp. NMS7]|uniref:alkaline phosphatase family protein n=1 Tax=Nostoc sp. NMS7 TaxID=2815391 RepID=UPI0025CCDB96|nr:alkaline phosphatase family protein [Nostoc sp. NMS7]